MFTYIYMVVGQMEKVDQHIHASTYNIYLAAPLVYDKRRILVTFHFFPMGKDVIILSILED